MKSKQKRRPVWVRALDGVVDANEVDNPDRLPVLGPVSTLELSRQAARGNSEAAWVLLRLMPAPPYVH